MGRLLRDNTIPTVEQLQELYEAAAVFKREQPWEFLFDSDIICVENPKDKMVGYCSVMGMGGEHYALGVYLGENGFSKFCQLLEQGTPSLTISYCIIRIVLCAHSKIETC